MSTQTLARSLILIACAAALPALAAGPNRTAPPRSAPRAALALPALSAAESDTLLWMREEEKVARDVYVKLYQRWKKPVFGRISTSEQRHFDAIGAKIDLQGLTDPALPAPGQFADQGLQAAYDELTATGLQSYSQALTVGATIEDMDIRDLQDAIAGTDDPALRRTYEHLMEGSKSHLRAFVGLLRGLGLDYAPQYIDELFFDAIVGV